MVAIDVVSWSDGGASKALVGGEPLRALVADSRLDDSVGRRSRGRCVTREALAARRRAS